MQTMELIPFNYVLPPRHGVLRVVMPVGADVSTVLAEVMDMSIAALSVDNTRSLADWPMRMLCSAMARVGMPTLAIPAASTEGVPDGYVAVADLPNPQDALGCPAQLWPKPHVRDVLQWRLFFVPTADAPESEAEPANHPGVVPFFGQMWMAYQTIDDFQMPSHAPDGVQELAVKFRAYNNNDHTPSGPMVAVRSAAVDSGDVAIPCVLDRIDEFGFSWIEIETPCSEGFHYKLCFEQAGEQYGRLTVGFFKKLPSWPDAERRAWTRCCVDAAEF